MEKKNARKQKVDNDDNIVYNNNMVWLIKLNIIHSSNCVIGLVW